MDEVQAAVEAATPSDAHVARVGYGLCVRGSLFAAGTGEKVVALLSICFRERAFVEVWLDHARRTQPAWASEIVEVELVGYMTRMGEGFAVELARKYREPSPLEALSRYFAEGTQS